MSYLAQEPFLVQEAEEAATWMSSNAALLSVDAGIAGLILDLVRKGEVMEDRAHLVMRRDRWTAVFSFVSGRAVHCVLRAELIAPDPAVASIIAEIAERRSA